MLPGWITCGLLVAGVAPSLVSAIESPTSDNEAAQFLSEYIKIDTTNPPGNEIAAARFLARRFAREHIHAEVFESQPGRASVLARLEGDGRERPIVLLSHLDVVPAKASEWASPPFAGLRRDGFIYGRGALDCKGVGTVNAMAMMQIRRSKRPLHRDVLFLATADEETGGKLGAGWMVENHLDKLGKAEFVLNEGGDIHIGEDGRRTYDVAISEKTPCWLRLTATGKAGHGSSPPVATSVTRLLGALGRLQAMEQPIRVTPEVQAYFAALAESREGALREHYLDLRQALTNETFLAEFLENSHNAALVRNTLTPTVLQAGLKTNVIPQSATAELDCRLLPGEDPQAFFDRVRDTIDDSQVAVEVLLNFPPSSSSTDSKLFRVLQAVAKADGARVVPTVLTGFTDSHYFRDKGIVSYGFTPLTLDDEEGGREHGVDERISLDNLQSASDKLVSILRALDDEEPPQEP